MSNSKSKWIIYDPNDRQYVVAVDEQFRPTWSTYRENALCFETKQEACRAVHAYNIKKLRFEKANPFENTTPVNSQYGDMGCK